MDEGREKNKKTREDRTLEMIRSQLHSEIVFFFLLVYSFDVLPFYYYRPLCTPWKPARARKANQINFKLTPLKNVWIGVNGSSSKLFGCDLCGGFGGSAGGDNFRYCSSRGRQTDNVTKFDAVRKTSSASYLYHRQIENGKKQKLIYEISKAACSMQARRPAGHPNSSIFRNITSKIIKIEIKLRGWLIRLAGLRSLRVECRPVAACPYTKPIDLETIVWCVWDRGMRRSFRCHPKPISQGRAVLSALARQNSNLKQHRIGFYKWIWQTNTWARATDVGNNKNNQ